MEWLNIFACGTQVFLEPSTSATGSAVPLPDYRYLHPGTPLPGGKQTTSECEIISSSYTRVKTTSVFEIALLGQVRLEYWTLRERYKHSIALVAY